MQQTRDPQFQPMKADGERFLPGRMSGAIELEHVHRYCFAAQFVAGKVVLDIASGEGYGTALLASRAQRAIGVDIAEEAIAHARRKYAGAGNLEYLVGSCSRIPLEDATIDVVVSFETIEHHDEHEAMMREIRRVLRPGGMLVISSPDKLEYADKPAYRNPFHVHELYREEFEALLAANFGHRALFGQRVLGGSALFSDAASQAVAFHALETAPEASPTLPAPVYWVAVASDVPLPAMVGGVLEESMGARALASTRDRNKMIAEMVQAIARPGSPVLTALLHGAAYLEKNPDLRDSGVDPEAHWNMVGRMEGRALTEDPGALLRSLVEERQEDLLAEIESGRRLQEQAENTQLGLRAELAEARQALADARTADVQAKVARDAAFADEMTQAQREATEHQRALQAKLDAALRASAARERELLRELAEKERGLRHAQREAEQRRRKLEGQLLQEQAKAQEQLAAQLRLQLQREKQATTDLERLREKSAAETALQVRAVEAQAQAHAADFARAESLLRDEIAALRTELRRVREEAARQVQRFDERLSQAHADVEAQASLRASREQAFSTQLIQIRQESEAERAGAVQQLAVLAQQHADRERQLLEAHGEASRQHARDSEALRAEIQRLRSLLAWMQSSRAWRWTSALRAGRHPPAAFIDLPSAPEAHDSPAAIRLEMTNPVYQPPKSLEPATTIGQLLALEDAAFVQCAYLSLLGRWPDPEGFAYYVARFRDGVGKLGILRQIRSSPEGRTNRRQVEGLDQALSRLALLSVPVLGPLLRSLGVRDAEGDPARLLRRSERRLIRLAGTLSSGAAALPDLLSAANDAGLSAGERSTPASAGAEDAGTEEEPFDREWYLAEYADVRLAGADPLQHYRDAGAREGRYPNHHAWIRTLFDVDEYRRSNPDLAGTDSQLFDHFLAQGRFEQRRGATLKLTLFDADYYLQRNPDVAALGCDPLHHFLTATGVTNRPFTTYRRPEAVVPELLTYSDPLRDKQVKVIAFYLPQFHPIPENDAWWGRGFTEWRNVVRAKAHYRDHDQPRLPGELGFYDLRVVDNMQRQAELARLHGVDAFCLYYYWFGGRRLLEGPLDMLLAHPEIDIEFCCCWANENWTRRWDGLESEVLMGQQHSPEDDIAFISEFSKMFADRRYVRVGGKPLVVVYRPGLFPDMKATAGRWRAWCRKNAIGEIFIACSTAFDQGDPRDFGLDGSIQFPPANFPNRRIEHQLADLQPDFAGYVFDYQYTAKSAKAHVRPDWTQFRGVTPGWDNTARKMERGVSFFGATPELYAEWLEAAVAETVASQRPEHRLVFVNAWNEWAEGAYLEPDSRHGYAYLNRTREVMARHARSAVREEELLAVKRRSAEAAVIVHLHYLDLFDALGDYLDRLDGAADLYFTVREGAYGKSRAVIKERFPHAVVVCYPNQGRDVLPFLRVMGRIIDLGYLAICKIHSKKSPHRPGDGEQWRDDLLEKLLGGPKVLRECLARTRQGAGVLGPAGHVLPGADYWGGNRKRVEQLAVRMGCTGEQVEAFRFIAGTMFWFSPEAVRPLLQLGLVPDDFESEMGQIDATMAHAVERLIGLSAVRAGLTVEEIGAPAPAGGTYQFAAKTKSA